MSDIPAMVHPRALDLHYEPYDTVCWRDNHDLGVLIKHDLKPKLPGFGDATGGHLVVALNIDGEDIDEVWTDIGETLPGVRRAIKALTRLEAVLAAIDETVVAEVDETIRSSVDRSDS